MASSNKVSRLRFSRTSTYRTRAVIEYSVDRLATEREQSGDSERGMKGERLLRPEHHWLIGTVSQRQISDDRLPVAGWAQFGNDKPAHLQSGGAAEISQTGGNEVQLPNFPELRLAEGEPTAHGRFEIAVGFSGYLARERRRIARQAMPL